MGGTSRRTVDSGCGGERIRAASRCTGSVARSAIVLRKYVVGDGHVCVAANNAASAPWAAWVCDVVWAGPNSGNDALPWGLVHRSTSVGGSLRVSCRNSWMVTVVMRIFVAACAVWQQSIAGCWVIGQRWPGWSGCSMDRVIRYTSSMGAVAGAIYCDRLQVGHGDGALLCS